MPPTINIDGRTIGPGHPTYIIAELSANHNQDYDRAVALVRAAKEAGADAVKLQTYTPDTMTIRCDNEHFRIKGTLWDGRTLHDLYNEAYTPWEWQPRLKAEADRLGIHLFSSPFDATSVDFLTEMNVPAFKIASFENVDLPLIRKVASTRKPVIISTGMATLAEIDEAVRTFREAGGEHLALLRCVSAYPSPPEEMDLRTIPHLGQAFDVPVGLSDHTLGPAAALVSVALGACIVEKHFAFSRDESGPDSAFSMEPVEFRKMVEEIRAAEKALGRVRYGPTQKEQESHALRRSLFVVEDVGEGEVFTEKNVRAIRPGAGLHTRHLDEVIGRRAARKVARGTPLTWSIMQAEDAPQ